MTMQEKIALMQTKRKLIERVFENSDGTWGHRYEFQSRYDDKASAEIAARFSEEWGCK